MVCVFSEKERMVCSWIEIGVKSGGAEEQEGEPKDVGVQVLLSLAHAPLVIAVSQLSQPTPHPLFH
jgi:hypothetical protein